MKRGGAEGLAPPGVEERVLDDDGDQWSPVQTGLTNGYSRQPKGSEKFPRFPRLKLNRNGAVGRTVEGACIPGRPAIAKGFALPDAGGFDSRLRLSINDRRDVR
jgi:hypothetical protein